jgi:alpha-tubulin suppressor-like RCC1 family protein
MPRVAIAPVLLVTILALAACAEDATSPTDPAASSSVVAAAAAATWTQVAVGGQHTCALASNGGAYCWGYAVWGQIGNGTTPIKLPNPTRVSGNLKFVQITAGLTHTCGVTVDNKAYCWGENIGGQLGDGTTDNRSAPKLVAGGRRYSQIRAGGYHTCAITTAGKAFCWGNGSNGQLGAGAPFQSFVPVAVKGGLTFRRIIAGGLHTCAITTADKAYCWGRGIEGQLGQGTAKSSNKPVAVSGGLSFQSVVPGSDHTCGATTSQQGYCWGGWGTEIYNGQLGNGDANIGRLVPTALSGGRKWRQIIAGHLHTCGVTQTDVPFCWGWNFDGQNGDGHNASTSVPTRVAGNLTFIGVSTGSQEASLFSSNDAEHSCGITGDGRIFCWGSNIYGQLGNGLSLPDQFESLTPVQAQMPS